MKNKSATRFKTISMTITNLIQQKLSDISTWNLLRNFTFTIHHYNNASGIYQIIPLNQNNLSFSIKKMSNMQQKDE